MIIGTVFPYVILSSLYKIDIFIKIAILTSFTIIFLGLSCKFYKKFEILAFSIAFSS